MSRVEVGSTYKLTSGRDAEVVELLPKRRCRIKIIGTEFTQECLRVKLSHSEVKDNYFPIVAGVGYFGNGEYKAFYNGRSTREYTLWTHMLERCYAFCDTKNPSYSEVIVCEEWHNFQNFAKWCQSQPEFYYENVWALDKDISFFKTGISIYSADTCFFVPREINNLFLLREMDRGDLPLGIREKSSKYQARVSFKYKRLCSPYYCNIEDAIQWYYTTKNNVKKLLADEYKELLSPRCYETLLEIRIIDRLLLKRI